MGVYLKKEPNFFKSNFWRNNKKSKKNLGQNATVDGKKSQGQPPGIYETLIENG